MGYNTINMLPMLNYQGVIAKMFLKEKGKSNNTTKQLIYKFLVIPTHKAKPRTGKILTFKVITS